MKTLTDQEVLDKFEKYQKSKMVHPLTCGINSNHEVLRLKKTVEGKLQLYCIDCNYIQSYIPKFLFSQSIYDMIDEQEAWFQEFIRQTKKE